MITFKNILLGSLTGAGLWTLLYLVLAFHQGAFNIMDWSDIARFSQLMAGGLVYLMGQIFVPIFNK